MRAGDNFMMSLVLDLNDKPALLKLRDEFRLKLHCIESAITALDGGLDLLYLDFRDGKTGNGKAATPTPAKASEVGQDQDDRQEDNRLPAVTFQDVVRLLEQEGGPMRRVALCNALGIGRGDFLKLLKQDRCPFQMKGAGWVSLMDLPMVPINRTEETPAAAAEPIRVASHVAMLEDNNKEVEPGTRAAVDIGRTLRGSFSYTDLSARLDGDRARAFIWIKEWHRLEWIESCGYQLWRATPTFGNGAV